MGTTAQKLQRVLDTKEGLKDTINTYLGQDITSAIPFKDYETYIKNFYNSLPKTSYAEGSNITLSNTLKGKLDFEDGIVGIGDTEQAILPSEYQQVEYIEGSGTQYITTNYKLTSNNAQIKTKVYIPEMLNTENDIVGNQDSATGRFIVGMYNKAIFGYSKDLTVADVNVMSSAFSGSQTLEIDMTYNSSTHKKTLKVNGTSTEGNYNASIISSNYIQIFVNGENNNGFTGRVYYVEVYDNGTLKLNLIPCYRISDNEIGMYDTVSKTFFTNAGTGTFTKGNNTPTPNVPMDIQVVRGKNLSIINSISTTGGGYINYSVSQLANVTKGETYTLSIKNNTSYTSNLNVRISVGSTYSTETQGNLVANGTKSYTFTASQSGVLNLNSRLGTEDIENALTEIQLEKRLYSYFLSTL